MKISITNNFRGKETDCVRHLKKSNAYFRNFGARTTGENWNVPHFGKIFIILMYDIGVKMREKSTPQ